MRGPYDVFISLSVLGVVLILGAIVTWQLAKAAYQRFK